MRRAVARVVCDVVQLTGAATASARCVHARGCCCCSCTSRICLHAGEYGGWRRPRWILSPLLNTLAAYMIQPMPRQADSQPIGRWRVDKVKGQNSEGSEGAFGISNYGLGCKQARAKTPSRLVLLCGDHQPFAFSWSGYFT